jgi:hypothetical protein
MNFGELIIPIVAIMAAASVLRALFGGGGGRRAERMMREMSRMQAQQPQKADPETAQLRDDVRGLKERVAVLERLITDQSSSLDREFEKLKNMD